MDDVANSLSQQRIANADCIRSTPVLSLFNAPRMGLLIRFPLLIQLRYGPICKLSNQMLK